MTSQESITISTPGDITVRVIQSTTEWDGLRTEWDRLFEESPTAAPPLHFDWLREWWRIYGAHYGDALRIIEIRRSGRLIGLLPLYEPQSSRFFGIRTLRFLSTGEAEHEETAAEAMDLLHAPGEAQDCLDAIELAVGDPAFPSWEKLELHDVSAESPLVGFANRTIANSRLRLDPCGDCHIADLSDGFEHYVAKLSQKTRKHARRLLRAVENEGMRFSVASDDESVSSFFTSLIALHQERWTGRGRPGCFAASRFTELHQNLAQRWTPTGRALLAKMEWNDEPVVVIYGFVNRGKFHFYQCGVRAEQCGTVESPGLAALLLLMHFLAQRGVQYFDFLKGSSSYKQRLSTRSESLVTMTAIRPSLATAAETVADTGRRALGRIARAFAGGTAALGLLGPLLESPDLIQCVEFANMLKACGPVPL